MYFIVTFAKKENTMKMQNLINSLKKAVKALKEDSVYYNWSNQCHCNAGIVCQAALGINAEQLEESKEELFGKLERINKTLSSNKKITQSWKNAIHYSCPLTGQSYPQIIKDLESIGITKEDIINLEYLSNPVILANSSIEKEGDDYPVEYYKEKENLIKYLVSWIEILQESVSDISVEDLEKQLTEAVTNEHFEKAAEIRDLIKQQYCHELV
jgi:hypothetical protein